jgi:hypothetical protein
MFRSFPRFLFHDSLITWNKEEWVVLTYINTAKSERHVTGEYNPFALTIHNKQQYKRAVGSK